MYGLCLCGALNDVDGIGMTRVAVAQAVEREGWIALLGCVGHSAVSIAVIGAISITRISTAGPLSCQNRCKMYQGLDGLR